MAKRKRKGGKRKGTKRSRAAKRAYRKSGLYKFNQRRKKKGRKGGKRRKKYGRKSKKRGGKRKHKRHGKKRHGRKSRKHRRKSKKAWKKSGLYKWLQKRKKGRKKGKKKYAGKRVRYHGGAVLGKKRFNELVKRWEAKGYDSKTARGLAERTLRIAKHMKHGDEKRAAAKKAQQQAMSNLFGGIAAAGQLEAMRK